MSFYFDFCLHVIKNSFLLSLVLEDEIILAGIKMDTRTIRVLANAISRKKRETSSLTVIKSDLRYEGIMVLIKAIPRLLTSLKMSYNRIGPNGVSCLFGVLPKCSLCILDLTDNSIGADGATAIADAFLTNTIMLTDLSLPLNNIGSDGAQVIGKALSSCKHRLRYLSLYDNNIGDDGACAFKDVNIKTIDMSINGIGARGAEYLADNLYVESLSLHYNRIGRAGANAFANSKSRALIDIDVWGNQLEPIYWKRVRDRILENRIETLIPAWVEYILGRAIAMPFNNEVSARIICMAFFGEKHLQEWETEEGMMKGMKRLFPLAEKALFLRLGV
jgi:hypothetical protein